MRHLKSSSLLVVAVLLSGCASPRGKTRLFTGIAGGGVLGAAGGAVFSPNQESRGMNALVFGLAGALAGGVIAALTEPPPAPENKNLSLKERELGSVGGNREFQLAPEGELPSFVKERLQPAVIEEYLETDRVSEEGDLHEPHKVYRIKRPAELSTRPTPTNGQKGSTP